ncbi:hypothetical protein HF313_05970 [Massilia atriviolacea]|uniref:Uncharacterized protein n=1 Tax=Massilia atriviolacea TaxID=2495579 RepID=A0A430HC86_9BURK|nr:hypothetical protein [Massilia atriviolacea]RSZ55133.1 hypothetical protein EJB06_31080 [Massilia atriviolacea]
MSFKFDLTLASFLDSKTDRCLLLGDVKHGQKSLEFLKAAVERLALVLTKHQVLILVEGPRNGEIVENDQRNFAILKKHGADIRGCEDDLSLSTEKEINAIKDSKFVLADGLESIYREACDREQYLLGKRIVDANESWERQIATELVVYEKVILCCGTSHLPAFAGAKFKNKHQMHRGLINTPHFKSFICGFAVESSNDQHGWYVPEKFDSPGSFGKVRTIE